MKVLIDFENYTVELKSPAVATGLIKLLEKISSDIPLNKWNVLPFEYKKKQKVEYPVEFDYKKNKEEIKEAKIVENEIKDFDSKAVAGNTTITTDESMNVTYV